MPDFETKVDAQAGRMQKAAETEARVRSNPSGWITLPGSSAVRKLARGSMPTYPGTVDSLVQSNPECIMHADKGPFEFESSVVAGFHKGPRYAWEVRIEAVGCSSRRDITTTSLRAGERIRYVTAKEINRASPHAKVSFLDASDGDQYITYGSQILCEILDPQYSYEKAPGWVEWTLARNEHFEDTVCRTTDGAGNVASVAGKTRTSIKVSDQKRGS